MHTNTKSGWCISLASKWDPDAYTHLFPITITIGLKEEKEEFT